MTLLIIFLLRKSLPISFKKNLLIFYIFLLLLFLNVINFYFSKVKHCIIRNAYVFLRKHFYQFSVYKSIFMPIKLTVFENVYTESNIFISLVNGDSYININIAKPHFQIFIPIKQNNSWNKAIFL